MFFRNLNLLSKNISSCWLHFSMTGANHGSIKHSPAHGLFYIDTGLGKAFIRYRREGRILTFETTMVPGKLRGQGLGSILAQSCTERTLFTSNLSKNQTDKAKCFYFSDTGANVALVKHTQAGGQFWIETGKDKAYLNYRRDGSILTLEHTEVPKELRGQGLGNILAKEALEYVARNNLRMRIECEFVYNFVTRVDPKYLKYIEK